MSQELAESSFKIRISPDNLSEKTISEGAIEESIDTLLSLLEMRARIRFTLKAPAKSKVD